MPIQYDALNFYARVWKTDSHLLQETDVVVVYPRRNHGSQYLRSPDHEPGLKESQVVLQVLVPLSHPLSCHRKMKMKQRGRAAVKGGLGDVGCGG